MEIHGPKGDVVASGQVTTEDSVVGFQWTVPEGQAGGEYTIEATYPFTGYPPAERKFDIRAYRAPRLKTQIKFLRDGYGPGDDVAATLHVTAGRRRRPGRGAGDRDRPGRRRGGVPRAGNGRCQGVCVARFQLPQQMARGEGVLALAIEDGGVVETASKTIPILLQTVDLTLYPEGGELVAGLPNRVYFEAFTPAQQARRPGRRDRGSERQGSRPVPQRTRRPRAVRLHAASGRQVRPEDHRAGRHPDPVSAAGREAGRGRAARREGRVRSRASRCTLAVAACRPIGRWHVTLAKRETVLATDRSPSRLGKRRGRCTESNSR